MPKRQPHEIELIAEAGWNAYAKIANEKHKATDEDPATPDWAHFGGEEKAKQVQICSAVCEHGSDGSALQNAYADASAKWGEKSEAKAKVVAAPAPKVEPVKPVIPAAPVKPHVEPKK